MQRWRSSSLLKLHWASVWRKIRLWWNGPWISCGGEWVEVKGEVFCVCECVCVCVCVCWQCWQTVFRCRLWTLSKHWQLVINTPETNQTIVSVRGFHSSRVSTKTLSSEIRPLFCWIGWWHDGFDGGGLRFAVGSAARRWGQRSRGFKQGSSPAVCVCVCVWRRLCFQLQRINTVEMFHRSCRLIVSNVYWHVLSSLSSPAAPEFISWSCVHSVSHVQRFDVDYEY